jgi:outer membrane lipoprotein carrier protein
LGAALLAGMPMRGAESAEDFLRAWLEAQRGVKTWQAEFVQTRTLKALTEPLRTPGRLWFEAPDRFRWELGTPPQTLVLRHTNELWVGYPRLKRVERYPLTGTGNEPWRDALALLDAGFPASRAEFDARFRLLSLARTNDLVTLSLEPRRPGARRFLKELRLTVRASDRTLIANEVRFADGSTLRNDFTNAVANAPLDPGRFEPAWPADFTLVEPLQP